MSFYGDLNDYFVTVFTEAYCRCENNDERVELLRNLDSVDSVERWVIENLEMNYSELKQAPALLTAILKSVDYTEVRDRILDYDSGDYDECDALQCFYCELPSDNIRGMLDMQTFELECVDCIDKRALKACGCQSNSESDAEESK